MTHEDAIKKAVQVFCDSPGTIEICIAAITAYMSAIKIPISKDNYWHPFDEIPKGVAGQWLVLLPSKKGIKIATFTRIKTASGFLELVDGYFRWDSEKPLMFGDAPALPPDIINMYQVVKGKDHE